MAMGLYLASPSYSMIVMVLDEVFNIRLPYLAPHETAMSHWRAMAAEGRTGGALWNDYELLYWETRMGRGRQGHEQRRRRQRVLQWLMAVSCVARYGEQLLNTSSNTMTNRPAEARERTAG